MPFVDPIELLSVLQLYQQIAVKSNSNTSFCVYQGSGMFQLMKIRKHRLLLSKEVLELTMASVGLVIAKK